MQCTQRILAFGTLLAILLASRSAGAARLGDMVEIAGARENQLIGYGVLTGLAGTGDDVSAPLAAQSILAMLRRLGVQTASKRVRLRNVAAVMVTANVLPFAKQGTKIDITVSSVGNAKSLKGGVLLQTLLKGADRKTYAVAQGAVVFGGFFARGKSGSSAKSGSTTVGRIPQGAIIEREIKTKFVFGGRLALSLKTPSFVDAARIVEVVNAKFGPGSAQAVDAGSVMVRVPKKYLKTPVALVAAIQPLAIKPDIRARVVVSEATQTIVAAGPVMLGAVAIVHGGLTIVVKEMPVVSQPGAPFTKGKTKVLADSDVKVEERTSTMRYMDGANTLSDLAGALGVLGLSARELISVLQALRSAGALHADLVVQ